MKINLIAPIAIGAGVLLALSPTLAAFAGGSDSPTPYSVTAEGITLPDGKTFPDGGHVNIRYTVGGGSEKSTGVHFESLNNQPSGQFVGESVLPWSYLIDAKGYCITWVQVANFNEHFGEGKQEPVCTTAPTTPPTTEPPVVVPPTEPPVVVPPTDTPSEPPVVVPPTDTPSTPPTTPPTEPPVIVPPVEVPPVLECPEGFIPGWLDEDGNPTACVEDTPNTTPPGTLPPVEPPYVEAPPAVETPPVTETPLTPPTATTPPTVVTPPTTTTPPAERVAQPRELAATGIANSVLLGWLAVSIIIFGILIVVMVKWSNWNRKNR